MRLLYGKSRAKSAGRSSAPRPPTLSWRPMRAVDPRSEPPARPSTREGLSAMLAAIDKALFGMFYSRPGAEKQAAPPGANLPEPRQIIDINDEDHGYDIEAETSIGRYYSNKVAQDKAYAESLAASQCQLNLQPDEGVLLRVEEMELEKAAYDAAMDVEEDGPSSVSVEEQVAMRLQPWQSEAMQGAADFLGSRRSSENVVLIEKYSIPMTEGKLKCLTPATWLNDEVINFYMCMLQEKDDILCARNPDRKPSHFFNLYFMSKLLEGNRYTYKNVKRWTKKFDIFSKDKVFFPVNISNTHWTMCVIHMTEKRIQYYDSMSGAGKVHLDALLRYLQDEHVDKKQTAMPGVDEWVLTTCIRNETPQQFNGYDCGLFTILFADFLSENLPLSFDQQHIPTFRTKICGSIMEGKLWYCEDIFP